MFLILSCSCLCPIHWSQVLSREWRCSWSNAGRRCSNYIWVINNLIAYKGDLILEIWQYMSSPSFQWPRPFIWRLNFDFQNDCILSVIDRKWPRLRHAQYDMFRLSHFCFVVFRKLLPTMGLVLWRTLCSLVSRWCHSRPRKISSRCWRMAAKCYVLRPSWWVSGPPIIIHFVWMKSILNLFI